jgi:hypothetical protein
MLKEATMKSLDVVKKALTDIEKGAIDASLYTKDMVFSGPVPKPMKRDEYVSLLKNIVAGSPDWNFHARDYIIDGDTIRVTVNITGTQTRTLPALMPGMQPLLPTNRRFALPEEHLTLKVRDGKIAECRVDPVPGGGVLGMLEQLGAQLKKAA